MSTASMRWGIGGLGVVAGLYGAYLLQSRSDFDQIVSVAKWLVGGVIIHDGLIAFATIALVVLSARVLPVAVRGPATIGFVVLGTLSVVAIPFLGSSERGRTTPPCSTATTSPGTPSTSQSCWSRSSL